MRFTAPAAVIAAVAAGALAVGAPAAASAPRPATTPIKHFVFLMQAGRTFDDYFGTYPGADGLPAGACQPLVPARPRRGCVRPFVMPGKPPPTIETSPLIAARQYDNGRMDGFVAAYRQRHVDGRSLHDPRASQQDRSRGNPEGDIRRAPSEMRNQGGGDRRAAYCAESYSRHCYSERGVAPPKEPSAHDRDHRHVSARDPHADAEPVCQVAEP